MAENSLDISPGAGRPELKEFLGALNGFLNKEPTPADASGYFKFLGIFCRSIGATEGHMLAPGDNGRLQSTLSFGLSKDFETAFNVGLNQNADNDTPIEVAFNQKEVVAIVDISKDAEIPSWYGDLLKKNDFKSMVAVPLVGPNGPQGILCAYYHDVCLFDQGTLNHLGMIGKMVGAANDRDQARPGTIRSTGIEGIDLLLTALSKPKWDRFEFFSAVASAASLAAKSSGAISGPVRSASSGLALSVTGSVGVRDEALSQRFVLPDIFQKALVSGHGFEKSYSLKEKDWGSLASYVNPPGTDALAFPLVASGKNFGAILLWRVGGPFTPEQIQDAHRVVQVASLAMVQPPAGK